MTLLQLAIKRDRLDSPRLQVFKALRKAFNLEEIVLDADDCCCEIVH